MIKGFGTDTYKCRGLFTCVLNVYGLLTIEPMYTGVSALIGNPRTCGGKPCAARSGGVAQLWKVFASESCADSGAMSDWPGTILRLKRGRLGSQVTKECNRISMDSHCSDLSLSRYPGSALAQMCQPHNQICKQNIDGLYMKVYACARGGRK